MARSHCENENVQFVQELAEVDGPFESPININFRDLTKLDLPSLVWNRSDSSPSKMKITNTGHTVIISGKWKSERPYLTGGPLIGKYVFSQIHFHWGNNDSSGSEHLVCGEGFPLEMHVAHFKTDYQTQECALREKDGMVILVYLFKIQEEPNNCLRKIINVLPGIQQACTSQPLDPLPILTLCNPFTDDYFMYWGSVVTPTCAHILLWLVCREPFGISKEQVKEFRQMLDSSQAPICSNFRNPQPLHKRNVFHVNSSRNLDNPLLPIKKMVGCYCNKTSEEAKKFRPVTTNCVCQVYPKNQEEIEENDSESNSTYECIHKNVGSAGRQLRGGDAEHTQDCYTNSVVVQSATVQSVPLLSEAIKNFNFNKNFESGKPQLHQSDHSSTLLTQNCGLFPAKKMIKRRRSSIKEREIFGSFNSKRAFSHIMDSLETLKSETCKKLKEIESINKEIRGMTFFCQNSEDKKWLQKIEKLMEKQKKVTLNASQGYFNELKKLAQDCHFDKFFDGKILSVGDNNSEIIWFNNIITHKTFPYSEIKAKGDIQLPNKATTLIQSFFEDIQDSEDLQTFEKEIKLKKKKSSCEEAQKIGDASLGNTGKVHITQKMFALGNLGDKLFIEIPAEEIIANENMQQNVVNQLSQEKEEMKNEYPAEKESVENLKKINKNINKLPVTKIKTEEIIPLHRVNVAIKFSHFLKNENETNSNLLKNENNAENRKNQNRPENLVNDAKHLPPSQEKNSKQESATENVKQYDDEKLLKNLNQQNENSNYLPSTSIGTFDLMEAQKMIMANIQKKQMEKNIIEEKQINSFKYSYKKSFEKSNKKQKFRTATLEEIDLKKKKLSNKNKKNKKGKKNKEVRNPSDFSSSSEDNMEELKSFASAKLIKKLPVKFSIEKSSSSHESVIACSPISPERKKLKLEAKQFNKTSNVQNAVSVGSVSNFLRSNDRSTAQAPFHKTLQSSSQMYDCQPTILVAKEDKTVEKKVNIKIVTNKFENNQQIYRISSPNSSRASGDSTKRVFKVGSLGSKTSCGDAPDIEKILEKPYEIFRAEKLTNRIEHKFSRNKSFTNLSLQFSNRGEITRRAFIENVEDRQKSSNEPHETTRELKNIQILESDKPGVVKNTFKPPLGFYNKMTVEENRKEQTNSQEKNEELEIDVLLNSKEFNNDKKLFPTHFQEGLLKTKIKRCNIEKYHFLENELQESKTITQNATRPQEKQNQEIIRKTESNKSFIPFSAPNMRSDSIVAAPENKKLPPPVSFAALKKNPKSRPHSAESLTSLKKGNRRKTKKRPHCCKRNSKHYIKKNSGIFKKLNKTEVKSVQLLNLSEEEQLKIITENVAKYLKNKLAEQKLNAEPEAKRSFKMIEAIVLQDLESSRHKMQNNSPSEKLEENESLTKEKKETVTSSFKGETSSPKNITKTVEKEEKPLETPSKEKIEGSRLGSKPVHNFIKRNKLMAGKYKRIPQRSPTEKNEETTHKKRMEIKKNKKGVQAKEKESKPLKNNNDSHKKNSMRENKEKLKQEGRFTNQKETQKSSLENDAGTLKKLEDQKKKDVQKKNQQISLPLQKVSSAKSHWLQPIMLTSAYLSGPIEIIENDSRKMNRYLMNVKKTNTDNLLNESFYDEKRLENSRNRDTIFTTDLEYLIKLQMCLNNEISANIENSMNYIKTLLNQEYNGSAIVEKAPTNNQMNYYNSNKQGVVLIEMNDMLDYSSSGSEFLEEMDNQSLKITEAHSKSQSLLPQESRASKSSQPDEPCEKVSKMMQEISGEDDYYSDSSYNCEISITLNTKALEEKRSGAQPSYEENSGGEDFPNNLKLDQGGESNSSRTTTNTPKDEGGSLQSIQLKHTRKKRKDGQISAEMKQKLLEILEKEIKREMGATTYLTSSENSSDGIALRWDESDALLRSHSTESGSENTEILAQISETMRQYLKEFKEKKMSTCEDNS